VRALGDHLEKVHHDVEKVHHDVELRGLAGRSIPCGHHRHTVCTG
jgi:hypothetical protein